MKVLFTTLGVSLLFICMSCNNKVIPLQHAYQEKPYEFAVAAASDQVWNQLVQVLTANGLAIKTIDRSTGIITTDPTSFIHTYTWESKEGSLANPDALVVCSKVRGPFTFATSLKPTEVTGQWTVLTREADHKTFVDIKLVNATGKLVVKDINNYGQVTSEETNNLVVKSTGVFEKNIEEALK